MGDTAAASVVDVAPRLLAAGRARVRVGTVATAFRAPLDEAFVFLKSAAAPPDLMVEHGRPIFLYNGDGGVAADDEAFLTVDFGFEVTCPFADVGAVRCRRTPAGRAARLVHHGPYDQLAAAYASLRQWCASNNLVAANSSWEVYGPWSEDPTALTTEVFVLLGA